MRKLVIYTLLFFCQVIMAQSASEAESLFNSKQYAKAKTMYEALLKKKPNDALNNYRLARCCYELNQYEDAVKYFERSGNRYTLKDLYLGEAYFHTYRFDLSVTAYQTFIATLPPADERLEELNLKLKKSELAARLLNRVEDIAIVDSQVVNKTDFLRYYKFSKELGTLTQQRLLLRKNQAQDKVTYTTQRGDRLCYSDSTRGNMDIYSSFKLLDGWSAPASISKNINTAANENYPFLMPDGITMYFASDGENSIGGYDLFITRYAPGTQSFLVPENIGMPFNSPANDYMMVMDELQKTGWFATDRNQPADKVMIYKFVPNDVKILFRSENTDSVRMKAQLKLIRKAKKTVKTEQKVFQQQTEQQSGFSVVINDSTIYTKPEQFVHLQARAKINEWIKLNADIEKVKTDLSTWRESFELEETEEAKNKLSDRILTSEALLIDLKKQAGECLTEAVNLEISNSGKR